MSPSPAVVFERVFDVLPQYFSRRCGVLGPRSVLLTLVRMSDPGFRSYQRGLHGVHEDYARYRDLVPHTRRRMVSTSAF